MDGQSEQGIRPTEVEKVTTMSAHLKTLFDLSSQYFDPLQNTATTEIENTVKQTQPFAEAVENQYGAPSSTIKENPSLLESFRRHNNEVLETALFYAHLFGLPGEQHTSIGASAALHDIAKADPAPSDVPATLKSDYTLLMHPERGASIAESLFKSKTELALTIGDKHIDDVVKAIRCHSGPIPGFMQDRLEFYNSHSDEPIRLAEIDPNHTPSIILLAADMLALGSPAGVNKIVQLRENIQPFRIADLIQTIQEKRNNPYSVRIDSALKSAYQGADMVRRLMLKNPKLEPLAEKNHQLMIAYFEKTKAELLSA